MMMEVEAAKSRARPPYLPLTDAFGFCHRFSLAAGEVEGFKDAERCKKKNKNK